MPLVPARRIGQAREHQVHDVVGQVVLAAGDEDLACRVGGTLPSGCGSARVVSRPRSEPAWASVRHIVDSHSPLTTLPR